MSSEPQTPGRTEAAGPPEHEYSRRVLYSLLLPAMRLAGARAMSLRELSHWLETAYFHELKARGLKMREMADVLDVSMRKVAMLSKQLKLNFLAPEREVELPRLVEFALWAEPLSKARLTQTFSAIEPEELDEALDLLVAEGRVVELEGRVVRYDIASPTRRMVGRNWMARIDALNNLMNNVADTVSARFFEADERAFARTLQLRIRPEDLGELQKMYEEKVWETLKELDERARGDELAVPIGVSILWAPQGPEKREEQDD